jgi:Ni2+-binding GTPase involved in maturation of urease and hydrogenase
MPDPRMIAVSARTGEGVDAWLRWIEQTRGAHGFPPVTQPT